MRATVPFGMLTLTRVEPQTVKHVPSKSSEPLFVAEQNCWRVAKADKLSLIVDAAEYFEMLRKVFISAERELLLIGWDFDFEIEMLPGQSDDDGNAPDGLPNQLGAFLEAVVEKAPDLHVYLLKWNGAVLAAPGRLMPTLALSVFGSDRIHFALDGHHPFGACHHQKIVVADSALAFCGGIDATEGRWDTPDHLPDDPRRVCKDGSPSTPWHDATSALSGPVAAALAELSRERWHRATGETLEKPQPSSMALWIEDAEVHASDVDVAIARTEPLYNGAPLINEIEQLFLASIRKAKEMIYIESQYFAAESIFKAVKARLRERDGPEIVVVNPLSAESDLEDDAMHVTRGRMIRRLKRADRHDRFRIFYPATTAGDPIYVHAKIMIADDNVLHLGSSNLNDRSMGFDTECNVAVEGQHQMIAQFRTRLLSEHLDVTPEVFNETLQRTKSLVATIEQLNSPTGRGLRKIKRRKESLRGKLLAKFRLLDPRYHPGEQSSAGKGLRPRHITMAAGSALAGYVGWLLLRQKDDDGE
ncbi:Phosphatidylserine/phosphatidylglycerophosphate/cardiolipin synthase [Sulfitobacter brevis]|uniref:Phospholipase D n=1 Tax=Sulfitobacter brevis TaxID=74348 RepID=A0A1I2DWA9_9RHOB|nr:phospholipase D-like domain-containing protein [Sulfitobacter brevis]SFE84836.1 Phosphatidylserine/phosphatidylglycerophosphate/cardiolipin synthase [Sulfitobacter brevis]